MSNGHVSDAMGGKKFMEQPIDEVMRQVMMNCWIQIYQQEGDRIGIPYVTSKPGAGKTEIMHALTKDNGWAIMSTHFATKPVEEFGGIPTFDKITIDGEEVPATIWTLPDVVNHLHKAADKALANAEEASSKAGKQIHPLLIWFMDDMHFAGPEHSKYLYEILTERKMRDYNLPKICAMVLAGNHGHNKAGSKTVQSAIINRVRLCPTMASFPYWKINFALPNNVHPAITAFLSCDQFNSFFHRDEEINVPWCSPRSWAHFSTELRYQEAWSGGKKLDDLQLLYLAQGYIDQEASSEFSTYYNIYSEFDIPSIIAGAKDYELPDDTAKQYALAYAVINFYINHKKTQEVASEVALILHKYILKNRALGFMIIRELTDLQTKTNKRNVCTKVLMELQDLDPDIMDELMVKQLDI